MGKTACVIGATGLVGRELVRQLLEHPDYGTVRVFIRRPTGASDPKLDERVVDFAAPETWHGALEGDALFSAMGTTIKQAGSKDAQYKVDYTYQWEAASAAAANGVPRLLLVSSTGADPSSRIFYSRMKGELDAAVSGLPFEQVAIFRPSLLVGAREVPRAGERAAEVAFKAVGWLPGLKRYRPISGEEVARGMLTVADRPVDGTPVFFTLDEIFTP